MFRCIGKIFIGFSYFDVNTYYLFPYECVTTVESILIKLAKLLFLVQEYLKSHPSAPKLGKRDMCCAETIKAIQRLGLLNGDFMGNYFRKF